MRWCKSSLVLEHISMLMLAFSSIQCNTAASSLLRRVNTRDHMSRCHRIAVGKFKLCHFSFFSISCLVCFRPLIGSIATLSPSLSLFSSKTALSTGCPRVFSRHPLVLHRIPAAPPSPYLKTTAAALKLNAVWAKRAQWSKMQRKTHFPSVPSF